MTYLTPDQVAEALGLSPQSVYKLIKEGDLSAYRFTNKLRVAQEQLDDYIARSLFVAGSTTDEIEGE
jgi:excisionase family DNA binding protein